ncbi:MAG: hypothetical protein AUG51_06685 [Acidobacteria bacterium 13_1_20CM_3_53_8]|nr:MAG: hypothetical protein AUG51_06685 [Acidobacteria bacterium 13_1_20CM_3_53_8]
MSNEEIEKMLEFIAKRQENFSENMEQAEARMNRLERAFLGLFNLTSENSKAIKELTEAQKRTDAQLAETDERLNIFIHCRALYQRGA